MIEDVERHGLDDLLHKKPGPVSMVRRVWLLVAGIALIILGIIGWLVPIMTGIPFWVAGLICLAQASERFRDLINFGDRKLPGKVRKALRWGRDKFHKPGAAKRASPSAAPR